MFLGPCPNLAAVLISSVLLVSCGDNGSNGADEGTSAGRSPPEPGLILDAGSRLEIKNIYLGVAYKKRGNFVGCDRVCLHVSLPADEPDYVRATLAGHVLRMENTHSSRHERRPNSYESCVSPDGLLHQGPLAVEADEKGLWFGSPPVSVPVELRAVFSEEGRYVEEHIPRLRLSAGYG